MYYMAHETFKAKTRRTKRPDTINSASAASKFPETKSEKKAAVKSVKKTAPETEKTISLPSPKKIRAAKTLPAEVSAEEIKRSPKKTEINLTQPKKAEKFPKKDSVKTSENKAENSQGKTLRQQTSSKAAKTKTVAPVAETKPATEKNKVGGNSENPVNPIKPTAKKVEFPAAAKPKMSAESAPLLKELNPVKSLKNSEKTGGTQTFAPEIVEQTEKNSNKLPVAIAKSRKIKTKNSGAKIQAEAINEPAENIETTDLARPLKPKKKKIKPISSAVFRGKKNCYDFEVFALDEPFETIPAVYIISKRITDRRKKGHHTLVCIGETNSVAEEIKKHRKSKCLRKNAANVISILKEEDAQKRLNIETDLKAAHSIQCNLKQ